MIARSPTFTELQRHDHGDVAVPFPASDVLSLRRVHDACLCRLHSLDRDGGDRFLRLLHMLAWLRHARVR